MVVDHCCKIVGKRVKNIEEIRPYIKDCTKLGHSVIIYFGEVFGSGKVSYEKIRSWKKTFKTTGGTKSVNVATKSGRSVTVKGNTNVSKVRNNFKGMTDTHFLILLKLKAYGLRWYISF